MRHNSDSQTQEHNPLGDASLITTIGLLRERAKLLLSVQPEVGQEFQKIWGEKILTGTVAEVDGNVVALLWQDSLQYTVHQFRVA